MPERVTILGDGAMATVCAMLLVQGGHVVRMWGHRKESVERLRADREQRRLLPGARIPEAVELTHDDAHAFDGATMVVSAIPTQHTRLSWQRLVGSFRGDVPVVSVSKGIEISTLMRPTEVITDVTGATGGVAALSGPNIAAELARGMPATAVAASPDEALARRVQTVFNVPPRFRVYTNRDLLGVELAGATKNVIALAAGILDGLGSGNNTKAALVTRGLVEITRLGVALGARADTFMGLAGLGDLITTCVSPEGRNRGLGEQIGKGRTLSDVLAGMPSVAEGVPTTKAVVQLARRLEVEMPITETLHDILFNGKDVRRALGELMSRDPKPEQE